MAFNARKYSTAQQWFDLITTEGAQADEIIMASYVWLVKIRLKIVNVVIRDEEDTGGKVYEIVEIREPY